MEVPSIHTSSVDFGTELDGLVTRIYVVRGQRWLAHSGVGHGTFMADQREQLRSIGREMSVLMAELIDCWTFMAQATPEDRAKHELFMRTAIRWMATCDVDMTMPWFRAYRKSSHRSVDRLRAHVSFFRGRLSFFGDDGVREARD